jgi:selenophosphate synthase
LEKVQPTANEISHLTHSRSTQVSKMGNASMKAVALSGFDCNQLDRQIVDQTTAAPCQVRNCRTPSTGMASDVVDTLGSHVADQSY